MHSLPVSVCPCLSESVYAHTFCMWLHCFDMLLCPDLRMKLASSSSWFSNPTSIFNSKYLLYTVHVISQLTYGNLTNSEEFRCGFH